MAENTKHTDTLQKTVDIYSSRNDTLLARTILTLIVIVCILLCYFTKELVTTFGVSALFAYLLRPIGLILSRRTGFSYKLCAKIIFILFFGFLFLSFALFVPSLYAQLKTLLLNFPAYEENFKEKFIPQLHTLFGDEYANHVLLLINEWVSGIQITSDNTATIIQSISSSISTIGLLLLVPILVFFFLGDYENIRLKIACFCEFSGLTRYKDLARQLEHVLSSYIKGMINVYLVLSVYYSLSLYLVGLDIAIIVGICSGFAGIVPIVGPAIAFISAVAISYATEGVTEELWRVMAIYAFGNAIEGTLITPKLVGNKIGLHPIVSMFSVLAGAKIFSIAGILLAIPCIAACKVILIYSLRQYVQRNEA